MHMKTLENMASDGLRVDERTSSMLKLSGIMARTVFYEAFTIAGTIGIGILYAIYNFYK